MRLTLSGSERGLNVDEVEAVVAVVTVLSSHVGREIQIHLHRTDEAHQKEVLHQDVRLTHTYHQVEAVGGLVREIGLAQGHQHGQLHDHLLCRLQTAIVTVIASVQDLDLHRDRLDHEDRLATLHHRLEGDSETVGGDHFLEVVDPNPTHALNFLAHVRPEDAGDPLRRHYQAFRGHLRQDIGQGSEDLPLTHAQGRSREIVMAGTVEGTEEREDLPHFIHRTTQEFQGLMLSRTVIHETIVV